MVVVMNLLGNDPGDDDDHNDKTDDEDGENVGDGEQHVKTQVFTKTTLNRIKQQQQATPRMSEEQCFVGTSFTRVYAEITSN